MRASRPPGGSTSAATCSAPLSGCGASLYLGTAERPNRRKSKHPRGVERPHENQRKTAILAEGGAESGAAGAADAPVDADLRAVVEAWPDLPEAARARILAIIEAAGGGRSQE